MRRRTSNAVIIRLDQSAILESSVTLPLNAERSLRPILQNQLERLVPLPADQVEFEYQIVARSPTAKTLAVRLIVATSRQHRTRIGPGAVGRPQPAFCHRVRQR